MLYGMVYGRSTLKDASFISRRKAIALISSGVISLPVIGLQGCSDDFSDRPPPPPDGFGMKEGHFGGPLPKPGLKGDPYETVQALSPPEKWATGGTSALQNVTYENPFESSLDIPCTVIPKATEGPCYSNTKTRRDISGGRDGLPVRLLFKVVDDNCQPIAGVSVDIWHCDASGIYSGDKMHSVNFCTGAKEDYMKHDWFRGVQSTDDKGEVSFQTCFPGWYRSRAIHIALRKDNQSYTTQVAFDDALVKYIMENETLYSTRGTPDTSNSTDTVFPHTGYETYLMKTKQLSDHSMLAWKTLAVSL